MSRCVVEFAYSLHEQVEIRSLGVDGEKPVLGVVLSLWFSDRGPKYEVAWWNDSARHEAYLVPDEIGPCGDARAKGGDDSC